MKGTEARYVLLAANMSGTAVWGLITEIALNLFYTLVISIELELERMMTYTRAMTKKPENIKSLTISCLSSPRFVSLEFVGLLRPRQLRERRVKTWTKVRADDDQISKCPIRYWISRCLYSLSRSKLINQMTALNIAIAFDLFKEKMLA